MVFCSLGAILAGYVLLGLSKVVLKQMFSCEKKNRNNTIVVKIERWYNYFNVFMICLYGTKGGPFFMLPADVDDGRRIYFRLKTDYNNGTTMLQVSVGRK